MSIPKNVKFCVLALILCVMGGLTADAQSIENKLSNVEIRPFGRMIRQCCNFGYGAPVYWIPVNMGYITNVDLLGRHVFYGDEQEGNGIIYSNRGGFLDLGHIRDNADLVAYFAYYLNSSRGNDTNINTVREAGSRRVELLLNGHDLSEDDLLLVAQRISYEMAIWHEIRTYFGVPTFWPVHEKQSAFSPEDNYSNLLGTFVGVQALRREGDFLKNVEIEINELLKLHHPVATSEATRKAMDDVRGLWWRKVSLPSNRFLLAKYHDSYGTLEPWLIPNHGSFFDQTLAPIPVTLPDTTSTGILLTDLFSININPISNIPVKKVLNRGRRGGINELDFPVYVDWIRNREEAKDQKKKNRKSKDTASE